MTTIAIIRNKMNPHNLAICFAPVLMLDTSDYLDLQVNQDYLDVNHDVGGDGDHGDDGGGYHDYDGDVDHNDDFDCDS